MTQPNKLTTFKGKASDPIKRPQTSRKIIDALGFNKNPAIGVGATAASGSVLGLLLSSILGSHRGKGMALGALGGLGAGLVMTPLAKQQKKASFSGLSVNSAVLRSNLDNFVANRNSFDYRAQHAIGDALRSAGRHRQVKDLTSRNPTGIVTIGDVARAGIHAGLSTLAAQTLGHVLGARNPRSWQAPGAAIGGALSLGHSTGFIR